jgi:hypothetical protein
VTRQLPYSEGQRGVNGTKSGADISSYSNHLILETDPTLLRPMKVNYETRGSEITWAKRSSTSNKPRKKFFDPVKFTSFAFQSDNFVLFLFIYPEG